MKMRMFLYKKESTHCELLRIVLHVVKFCCHVLIGQSKIQICKSAVAMSNHNHEIFWRFLFVVFYISTQGSSLAAQRADFWYSTGLRGYP